MATLAKGTVLGGRYLIVRAIKSGGMGVVYEARDERLAGTSCAIKQLLDEDHDDESVAVLRRKFDEEMQFLATLSHPGIPRLRDFFSDDRRQYLVMDLVEGDTLEQELDAALADGHALDPFQVVDDALEVLEILSYLHSRKPPVVHRDVKPANMIRERTSGRIKLLDFGIARLHEATSSTTHTQLGTLCYAPLEQIQGHAEPRSDIYALGATMHHLISGKESPALAIPPLQRLAPGLDADLVALVNRAVQPAAIDRFDSAADMAAALQAWKRERRGGSRTGLVSVPGTGTAPLSAAGATTNVRPAVAGATAHLGDHPPRRVWPIALAVAMLVALLATYALRGRPPLEPAVASASPRGAPTVEAGTPLALSASTTPVPVTAVPVTSTPSPHRVAYATRSAVASPAPKPVPTATPPRGIQAVEPPAVVRPSAPLKTPAPPPVAQTAVDPAPPPEPRPTAPPPPPQDRPAGGPPSEGPPGAPPPPVEFQPALPQGWVMTLTSSSEHPPRKNYRVTSAQNSGAGAIDVIVWIMPVSMAQEAAGRVLEELGHQQWRADSNQFQSAGAVQSVGLNGPGGVGALQIRFDTLGPRDVRMVAAALLSPNASGLQQLRQVAEDYLLR